MRLLSPRRSKRRYLYLFTEPFPATVIDSQVVEPITLLDQREIHFDLVASISAGMLLRGRREIARRRAEVASRIAGRVMVVPHYRIDTRAGLLSGALAVAAATPWAFASRELVIHARGVWAGIMAAQLVARHPGGRLVLDVRGHLAELDMMAARGDDRTAILARSARGYLRTAVARAHAIIAVSGPLRDWLVADMGADPEKIRVVPCLANEEVFRFDEALRAEVRAREGLEDARVVVFPGSTGRWHYLPETLAVVRELMQSDDRVVFLALTPQVDAMQAASREAGLPESRVRVLRAAHHEVVGWLNASDAGVLLRERHPVNAVASPTKFAEYLLTGLPVIINPGIGDYSDFVGGRDVGLLVNEHDPATYVGPFARLMDRMDERERHRIAGIGRAHFAKDTAIPDLARMYSSI